MSIVFTLLHLCNKYTFTKDMSPEGTRTECITSAVHVFECPYVLYISAWSSSLSVLRDMITLLFLFQSKLKYQPSRIIPMAISY